MPQDYRALLTPKDTQQALFAIKHYIEEYLCQELHLMMVTVPLLVDVASGINDMLDRDGSRTPMLLKKAHLGKVSVSVWPTILKDICKKKNIDLLE